MNNAGVLPIESKPARMTPLNQRGDFAAARFLRKPKPMVQPLRWAVVLVVVVMVTACAGSSNGPQTRAAANPSHNDPLPDPSVPFDPFDEYDDFDDDLVMVADPFVGFNRAMFVFNDKMYFWVLKPVASGYRFVLPTPVRVSVRNFFFNLLAPVRLANCLFQGKFRAAEGEFGRFVVNSTAGMLGLFDLVANKPQFNPPSEDFGQTLGYWGIGNGFFIVWPLLGPSTLRDTVGTVGDLFLNPFQGIQLVQIDAGELTSTNTNLILTGVRIVNDTSFRIGDYEALKNAALDPYEAFRDAYIQFRNSQIAQ